MIVCALGFLGGIVGGWFAVLVFWGVGLFVCFKNPKLSWPENTVFQVNWQDLAFVI